MGLTTKFGTVKFVVTLTKFYTDLKKKR